MFASKSLLAALAGAALTSAQTPAGFTPSTSSPLVVAFGTTGAMNGTVMERNATQTAPLVGLMTPMTGTFAILMIDLDIPASFADGGPTTLLHWMQTGFSVSQTPTTMSLMISSSGTMVTPMMANQTTTTQQLTFYPLTISTNTSVLATYAGPSPPAMVPLSHRYTQVVIDMTDADADAMAVLEAAAEPRVGFDAAAVLAQAGLDDKVVAGNFFNVTNPGPAEDAGMGGGNGTNTGENDEDVPVAGAGRAAVNGLMAGLVGIAGVFLGL